MEAFSTEVHGITPDQLLESFSKVVEQHLLDFESRLGTTKQPEYLDRKGVADLLGISLMTLHTWTKNGILTSYKVGNKVLYKKDEIDSCLRRSK